MRNTGARLLTASVLSFLILMLIGIGSAGAETGDPVLINEILASHTGADNTEFIEFFGTPGFALDGLSLIVVESDEFGPGEIDRRLDFGPEDIVGVNGYLLIGNSIGLESNYGVLPNIEISSNYLENSSLTVAIVETSSLSGTAVSGAEVVYDAVALNDGDADDVFYFGAPVIGPDGSFFPAGARRAGEGVDTDDPSDWVISDFFLGDANTPTAGTSESPAVPEVIINEIRIDQPGTDNDEYFELAGEPGTLLDGLTYLVIGDGTGGSGVIEAEVDLSGQTIPGSGYFVAAEGSFTLGTANLTTGLNFENSDNVTHLLVAGFTGSNGDDLDNDDDGVLDSMPWSDVVDSVALVETPGSGDKIYSPTTIGPDGRFVPAHVLYCEDGWRIGPFSGGADTPGGENPCDLGLCGDPATFIHEVQGSGFSSPLIGELVVVEGVVVGDFQVDGLDGFFLQEEDGDADGDPVTSEGVFVYDPGFSLDVSTGDVVRVLGSVSEFFDMTQVGLTGISYCSDEGIASTEVVTLPVSSVGYLERLEGMAVTFPQELRIAEFFNFDRFGEIVLTTERQFQPTAVFEPGSADAAALADLNERSRIMMDDGRTVQNPDPAIHPNGMEFTLDNRFRGGDIVQNLTGVMHYSFNEYRVQPTEWGEYTAVNERPADPPEVGGEVRVAAFNVLNYFTTIDDGSDNCGPNANQGCRGADDFNELERQRTKIVAALAEMDADIVGLIEIQNDEDQSVADLVAGLNDVVGAGTYEYIATGYIGTDAIKQALIYKSATVTPLGDFAVLDSQDFVDPRNIGDDKNRPALAQTFQSNAEGAVFTVVVNHLKSKGSPCGPGDDDPEAASCNLTRTLAAQVLVDWLDSDPTGSGDEDFLIIGDLNAYDHEDPIDVLRAAGYADLLLQYQGEYAYTYVFDGQLGYLDYALASPGLIKEVAGAAAWIINADEPDILNYDTSWKQDAQDALYEPNAFRSSDHDPVIAGLNLNLPPVCDGALPSVELLWPVNHKLVAVEVLGVVDPEGDAFTISIDSIFQDEFVNDGGDGDTAPDAVIYEDGTFELRAERSGDGNGRVYTIAFTATDYYGGACASTVTVGVPHDQGKKADPPIDDGALYDSTEVPEPTPEPEASEAAIEEDAGVTEEPTEEPTAEPDVAQTPEPPEASNGKGKNNK